MLVSWRILPANTARKNGVFCSKFWSGNEILLGKMLYSSYRQRYLHYGDYIETIRTGMIFVMPLRYVMQARLSRHAR